MGALRYLLSLLVLISHMGISVLGVNPGVVAVVIFYLLSGFVVQKLLSRQPITGSAAWQFYRDRSWRIMPLYLAALALATGLWALGAQSAFIARPPGGGEWLANLLIIPLNYYMYSGIDQFTLLPPAWSLGAEVQYYLLAPLLVMLPPLLWRAILLASLLVFSLAQLALLNTDTFGYRLLAGVLFIFMLGMHMASLYQQQRLYSRPLVLLWLVAAGYLGALLYSGQHRPYDQDVATGLVLGIVLVSGLARVRLSGALQRFNQLAGNAAYGVFLVHFPVIWFVEMVGINDTKMVCVVTISTGLAVLGHLYIERPLWSKCRHQSDSNQYTRFAR